MLNKSKGKYRWQRKATWSIDCSMSPVILAYLETLLSQLDVPDYCGGIPMHYCKKAVLEINQELSDDEVMEKIYEGDFDHDLAHNLRIDDIKFMIYGFDERNAPDILNYDFDFLWDQNLHCTNEEEMARYQADDDAWSGHKAQAHKMFGELYATLDW